ALPLIWPSDFLTSQQAPRSAYPKQSPKPHNTVKLVIQPNGPPEYWPSVNCSPSTRAPTITPCMKLATREPQAKQRSQIQRRCASLRNSNDTPRRTKPASMITTG